MKKARGWCIAAVVICVICIGIWGIGKATEEYPEIGEAVSYAVNDVDDISLEIDEPSWSPFHGYTIRWKVNTESENTYRFDADGTGFEFLECCIDGKWYRLAYTQDNFPYNSLSFELGKGESLAGSVVQKFEDYGTRLEQGLYRLTLEMTGENGDVHYLAQEFEVE